MFPLWYKFELIDLKDDQDRFVMEGEVDVYGALVRFRTNALTTIQAAAGMKRAFTLLEYGEELGFDIEKIVTPFPDLTTPRIVEGEVANHDDDDAFHYFKIHLLAVPLGFTAGLEAFDIVEDGLPIDPAGYVGGGVAATVRAVEYIRSSRIETAQQEVRVAYELALFDVREECLRLTTPGNL